MKSCDAVTAATPVAGGCAGTGPRICYLGRMRALSILVGLGLFATACGDPYEPGPGFPYPDGGGYPPGPGVSCLTANDCVGGDVCARDDECVAPADARSVMVRWTVGGAAASTASCAPVVASGKLQITYTVNATGEITGFSPLMCGEGQFFVDIWPARFDHVTVESVTSNGAFYLGSTDLGASGNQDVTVDLEPQ